MLGRAMVPDEYGSTAMVQDVGALYEAGETVVIVGIMPPHDSTRDFVFLKPLGAAVRDILLHSGVLRLSGILEPPAEGAALRCLVEKTDKGPRATKVLGVERPKLGGSIRPDKVELGPEPMVVKSFFPTKGYGFCTRQDGIDVFVHVAVLNNAGIKETAMIPGVEFKVTYAPGKSGFRATKIAP